MVYPIIYGFQPSKVVQDFATIHSMRKILHKPSLGRREVAIRWSSPSSANGDCASNSAESATLNIDKECSFHWSRQMHRGVSTRECPLRKRGENSQEELRSMAVLARCSFEKSSNCGPLDVWKAPRSATCRSPRDPDGLSLVRWGSLKVKWRSFYETHMIWILWLVGSSTPLKNIY